MTTTGGVRRINLTSVKSLVPSDRLRNFVFTLNNYTALEYEYIKSFKCKWMVVGQEVGDSGTEHLQGAVVLGYQISFKTLKQTPGFERAHIERMRGKPEHSLAYCSKQDLNPFIKGVIPEPGKRTDMNDVVERIQNGESLEHLATDPNAATVLVKYHNGLTKLRSLCSTPRTKPPVVIWLHGPTGTGKSRTVYDFIATKTGIFRYWSNSGDLKWFDRYDGQEIVLIDDFRTNHIAFSFLLRILDRYPLHVPIKGSFVNWNPHYIFITAPASPRDTYNLKTTEQLDQLERRINHTIDMGRCTYPLSKRQLVEYGMLSLFPELVRSASVNLEEHLGMEGVFDEENIDNYLSTLDNEKEPMIIPCTQSSSSSTEDIIIID